MTEPIAAAFRFLAHFWLEEVKWKDVETIVALPELSQTLPVINPAALTDLAAEYQRLFGFNLPPYESIFIDPSAMLLAPATGRVQALYQQGGWQPPAGVRIGAPDHLGAELLALADWLAEGHIELAHRLHGQHLALWAPVFVLTLRRLSPPSFYARLGDLTLDLLLTTLHHGLPPERAPADHSDPFPDLPPPPVYRGTEDELPKDQPDFQNLRDLTIRNTPYEIPNSLGDLIRGLLPPRQVGLFFTREDIALLSRSLNLPVGLGERFQMFESLFRGAGQYELLPALFDRLRQWLTEAGQAYHDLAREYPQWAPYGRAWGQRLAATQARLETLRAL